MNNSICYFNGLIQPEKETSISISDLSFLRGYGVFEFLRTYNGRPFLLSEHIERLINSVKIMSIDCPISQNEISQIILQLIKHNNITESSVRCVLTGGVSKNGMWPTNKPTILVMTNELESVPPEIYNGVKLITDNFLRHVPEAKTIDYSNLVRQQKRINVEKAFSLLYTNEGNVLEAAISNFFIIKDRIVITPEDNILKGTTRNLLINIISSGYKVEERNISLEELNHADEAFITGTTQGVVPVICVDNITLGNGKAGVQTKAIMSIFSNFVNKFINEKN